MSETTSDGRFARLIEDAKAGYAATGFKPKRVTFVRGRFCCPIGAAEIHHKGLDTARHNTMSASWAAKQYGLTSFEVWSFIHGFDDREHHPYGDDLVAYQAGREAAALFNPK